MSDNLSEIKTEYNDTKCSICSKWFNHTMTHVEGFKHQCFWCVNDSIANMKGY